MAETYDINFSTRAEEDLNGILHYLLNKYSHEAATRTYLTIRSKIADVSKMPSAYTLYRKADEVVKRTYRYAIAGKYYRVIFTIKEVENKLRIVRVANIKEPESLVLKSLEEE